MDRRFFHRIGASLLDRTICATAGSVGWGVTYGDRMGPTPVEAEHARFILLWGTNTLTSNPHLWPALRRAREAGRAHHRHRPHPHAHGRAVRRAPAHPPRHRRRAGAGDDARHLPRRAGGRGVPARPHRRLGGAAGARGGVDARAHGADDGAAGGAHRAAGARVRHGAAQLHPPELRAAAARGGGMAVRAISHPSRRHGRVARPGRRRHALHQRRLQAEPATRCSGRSGFRPGRAPST